MTVSQQEINLADPIRRRAMTVADFTQRYGISRAKVYKLLKTGDIHAVKVGRRTLIPSDSAESWFSSLPRA